MDWFWFPVMAVIAASCGFAGGWAAIAVDGKRRKPHVVPNREVDVAEVPRVKEADWSVYWQKDNIWVLTNTGSAKATAVDVQFEQFTVETSNLRGTMQTSGEASFTGYLRGKRPAVLITWTTIDDEQRGPARRAVPLQGNRRWQDW
ncbi:hypothetical protein [Arthrobacter sp. H20]|uniref:hypothetical protein n=1 Tax=Arthrobacter sp. H20 TaxID=1267981 RepID=UPI00047B2C41|nr:hypothetical protein [Arthrobacter sp. H20]